LLGKLAGNCLSDAAARARYDRDLPGQQVSR